jgi:dTDP-glucose 4,6-dehydratase
MNLSLRQILGRAERDTSRDLITSDYFAHKRVLVMGGAGSIGRAIIHELIRLGIRDYVAADRDENGLHSLQLEIGGSALFDDKRIRLCDIRDLESCVELLLSFEPDVVVHAAAHKHLSALEQQPREAFLTNIVGTQNLIKAANMSGVKSFVNISTDKAADPISVLGKSKRVAEQILESQSTSKYALSVRFGNVFASKGSVIETFAYQIEKGLPVTLTDIDVERYFMSDLEAAHLVLESITLNQTGLFVLEMGSPVKMINIIEALAQSIGKEAKIEITGLRPGEKLSEVVFGENENEIPTLVPRIRKIVSQQNVSLNNGINFNMREFTPLMLRNHSEARDFFNQLKLTL